MISDFLDLISGVFDMPWWGYVVVTLVMTHITIASITIYLHRHSAHRESFFPLLAMAYDGHGNKTMDGNSS